MNGVHLESYREGHTYELASTLANYLVAEGYALIEMRRGERRRSRRNHDRRHG